MLWFLFTHDPLHDRPAFCVGIDLSQAPEVGSPRWAQGTHFNLISFATVLGTKLGTCHKLSILE